MNRRSYNSMNSNKAKARSARVRDKALKMKARVKQSMLQMVERREQRLGWWQRTFRTPLVSFFGWARSRCNSFVSAMMLMLGLKPRNPLAARHGQIKSGKRNSPRKLNTEGLEKRQLLAADFTVSMDESARPYAEAIYKGTVGDDAPTGIVTAAGTAQVGDSTDSGATEVTELPTDTTPQNLIDNDGTLIVQDVDFVKKQSGAGFIGGSGSVTIDGDTTFTIEVEEDGEFLIDLDVVNSGTTPTATAATSGTVSFDISTGLHKYTAPADGSITSDSFNFSVGSYSGTVDVNISLVNDAPTLTVPADTSTVEDTATPALTGFVVGDEEMDALTAEVSVAGDASDTIAVIGAGSAVVTGTGPITIDGTPSEVQDTLNSLVYTPTADFFGTTTISVSLTDGDSTPVVDSFDVEVDPVNDAPVLMQVRDSADPDTIAEGGSKRIRSSGAGGAYDLEATDVDHAPTEIIYKVASLSYGTLRQGSGGSAVTLGIDDTFTQANLEGPSAERIFFDHDGTETSVSSTAGFTFTVADDSGAPAAGGPFTYVFNVNEQNDAPEVENPIGAQSATEGELFSIDLDTVFSDADLPGDSLTYSVSGQPGWLTLVGSILSGTPANGDVGSLSTVAVTADDNSAVAPGNLTATDSFDLDVLAFDDPPVVGGSLTVSVSEDDTVVLSPADLGATDIDNSADELTYTVTTPPVNGTLKVLGVAAGSFTQEDVDLGNVSYEHDGSETTSDSFVFDLSDGENVVSGTTFSISVNPVNDEESLDTNETLGVTEGESGTIADLLLSTSDVDNTPSEIVYTVTSGPAGGQLDLVQISGTTYDITSFTQENIDDDEVVYVHGGGEDPTDSFVFEVDDGAGSATTGVTFNIDVLPVNDAPIAIDQNAGNIDEDTVFDETVGGVDIPIEDIATDEDDMLDSNSFSFDSAEYSDDGGVSFTPFADAASAGISYVPATGALSFDPTGVALFQELAAGESLLLNVVFEVTDGTATDSGTITFTVDGVNDEPGLTTGPMSVAEGQSFKLTTAQISIVDPDTDPADIEISVRNGPVNGSVNGGASFTYQDLLDDLVYYVDMSPGAGMTTFTVDIDDGQGVAGPDNSGTVSVTITEVNDLPVLTVNDGSASFDESTGTPIVLADGVGGVEIDDVDDMQMSGATVTILSPVADDVLAFTTAGTSITGSFTGGVLTLSGVDTIANYELVLNSVTFANTGENPDNFGTQLNRVFEFVVNDGEDNSNTISLLKGVDAENDNPVVTVATPLAYTENDPATFVDPTLTLSDDDNEGFELGFITIDANTLQFPGDVYSLTNIPDLAVATLPTTIEGNVQLQDFNVVGTDLIFTFGPVAGTTASLADFEASFRSLTYSNTSDAPAPATRTVTFQVYDGNFDATGLSNEATVTIDITPVDDAPVVTVSPMTIVENQSAQTANYLNDGAGVLILDGLDPDGVPAADLVYEITGISHPLLVQLQQDFSGTSNGNKVTQATNLGIGDTFTQAQLNSTDGDEPGSGAETGIRIRSLGPDVVPDQEVTFTFDVYDVNNDTVRTEVTLTVGVTRVNDNPRNRRNFGGAADNLIDLQAAEDGSTTITLAELGHLDEETSQEDLTITLESVPARGSLMLAGSVDALVIGDSFTLAQVDNGDLTYVRDDAADPAEPGDNTPDDSFDYAVTDLGIAGAGGSTLAEKTITGRTLDILFTPVNDAPVAVDDAVDADEDGPAITGNVRDPNPTTADSDAEGDMLTVTEVNGEAADVGSTITLTSGATLTLAATGDYTYDPNGEFESLAAGETATDSFEYTIDDGNGGTDTALVTVTIAGDNDAPEVAPAQNIDVSEDTMSGTVVGSIAVSDVDATDTLTFTDTTGGGPFSISSTGEVTLTGSLDFETTGSYTLTFDVSDTTVSVSGSIGITVIDANDAPVLTIPAGPLVVNEEATLSLSGLGVADQDGGSVTVSLSVTNGSLGPDGNETGITIDPLSTPTNLIVSGLVSDVNGLLAGTNGEIQYTGDTDVAGTPGDTLSVTADDGSSGTDSGSVDINIDEVNDAPIEDAATTTMAVDQDVPLTVNVLDNALPGPASESTQDLIVLGVSSPGVSGASVSFNATSGDVTYQPAPGFIGTDSFTYTLQDNGGIANGGVDSKLVTVNVVVSDVLPVANDITLTVTEGVTNSAPRPNLFNAPNSTGNASGTPTVLYINGNPFPLATTVTMPNGATLRVQNNGGVQYTSPIGLEISSDSFTYQLEDAEENLSAVANFDITIEDANDNPTVADLTGPITASEGDTVTLSAAGTTDADLGAAITYTYAVVSSPSGSSPTLVASGDSLDVTFDEDGVYTIEVTATDRFGTAHAGTPSTATHTITVENVSPTVVLTGESGGSVVPDGGSVNEGQTFVLSLGAITDPGADTISKYTVNWGDGSITPDVPYSVGGANSSSHLYADDTTKINDITVDLFDEDGVHFGAGTFVLDVNNLNPTVVAINKVTGDDEGDTFSFTATATDPATTNDPLVYVWDFGDGSAPVTTVTPSVTHVYAAGGTYTLELTVNDDDGGSATDTLSVFVNSLIGPVADSDSDDNEVSESPATFPTSVGVTGLAIDADVTDVITYSITDDPSGLFGIVPSTGEVLLTSTAVDAESATSHTIEITATSDDGSSSSESFTIEILDDNLEFSVGPISDTDGADNEVAENAAAGSPVGITASAEDQDVTDEVSYSLTDDAGGLFTIDPSSGIVSTTAPLDAETSATYTIEVAATSDDGSTSTQSYTIEVLDDSTESAVGAVSDADAAANEVLESAASGTVVGLTGLAADPDVTDTVTYSLTDDAGGLFDIDENSGVVTLVGTLDAETATSHTVEITAESSDGSTSSETFTINVLDDTSEFAAGSISDSDAAADEVAENALAGTAVGITAFAEDDDVTDEITYSLSDDAGGLFTIDPVTGIVSTTGPLDAETATSYTIEVTATSDDGSISTKPFTVAVVDDNTEDPVGPVTDTDGSANEIDENVGDAAVGIQASATDPDATDAVVYSLETGVLDNDEFSIDTTTGVVSTKAAGLDYEAGATRTIRVTATSSDTTTSTEDFTIVVNDVSESDVGPVSDSDAAANEVLENQAAGQVVGLTGFALDPDTGVDSVTYSLTDDAGGLFAIDSVTGVVETTGALDAEGTNPLTVEITATSTDGSVSSATFSIDVLDEDDNDVGPVTDANPIANVVLEEAGPGSFVGQTAFITAFAEDIDQTNNTVSYMLAGGVLDNDRFSIDPGTGEVVTAAPFDAELETDLQIEVTATSTDGSMSTEIFDITIFDLDDNDVGAISDTDASADEILENAAIGSPVGLTAFAEDLDASDTVEYSLAAGGDNDMFAVNDSTGVVTTAAVLDAEQGPLDITVIATSTDGSTSSASYTINVLDVDEFDVGAVTDSDAAANEVAENAAGAYTGVTASASDDDISDSVEYSLPALTLDNDLFVIDATTGEITTAVELDYETATSHDVQVVATSTDGSTATEDFTISVLDVADSPVGPVADVDGAEGGEVAEDAAIGATVGITAEAIDPDGETVTYTLSDDAGGLFAIDANTGVVTVAGGLDFETATSHSITVLATSTDTTSSSKSFTIIIQDVDDTAPEAASFRIRSQGWHADFLTTVDASGLGYEFSDGEVLPWVMLDTLTIQFSEEVNIVQGSLSLAGLVGDGVNNSAVDFATELGISSFNYSAMTATWVFTEEFAALAGEANAIDISLSGVTDTAGNPLAALAVDDFAVNPGDIDQNGVVDFNDLADIYPAKIGVVPSTPEEILGNVRGSDNIIDFNDLASFYPNRIGVEVPFEDNSNSSMFAPGIDDDDDEKDSDKLFGDDDLLDDVLF